MQSSGTACSTLAIPSRGAWPSTVISPSHTRRGPNTYGWIPILLAHNRPNHVQAGTRQVSVPRCAVQNELPRLFTRLGSPVVYVRMSRCPRWSRSSVVREGRQQPGRARRHPIARLMLAGTGRKPACDLSIIFPFTVVENEYARLTRQTGRQESTSLSCHPVASLSTWHAK